MADFLADNNCYYQVSGTARWRWGGASYTTIGTWQTGSGQDAAAIVTDPTFVTNFTDLHLQTTSGCKDTGKTGLGVTTDYDDVARDATPDMGAFEFV